MNHRSNPSQTISTFWYVRMFSLPAEQKNIWFTIEWWILLISSVPSPSSSFHNSGCSSWHHQPIPIPVRSTPVSLHHLVELQRILLSLDLSKPSLLHLRISYPEKKITNDLKSQEFFGKLLMNFWLYKTYCKNAYCKIVVIDSTADSSSNL